MDPELMAAMNAGIAQANGTTPTPTEPTGAPDDDAQVDATGSEDDGADNEDSAGQSGAEAGGAPADGADTTDGDSEPDATDPPVGAAGTPPKDGVKPGEKADGAGAVKPADPLNDPLPNALKRETKERITTLVGMVKDTTTKLERVSAEHNEMMGYIRETQATPEQYGQALTYLKLVNSSSREDKEQALEIMQAEVAALARMIGKPVPGVNILEGHDDLIADVAAQRMSMERAAELAAAREAQNFQRRQGETTRQAQAETREMAQARDNARTQLNALEQVLMRDPAYKQKRPILVAQMKPIFAQLHPSRWATAFRQAYDALPASAAPRPTPPATMVPKNTPLRASNPAGGSVPAPKSMLEAVEFGLKNAR
jgi:hypothetical protein